MDEMKSHKRWVSGAISTIDLTTLNHIIDTDKEFEMMLEQKYQLSVHLTCITSSNSGRKIASRMVYDSKTKTVWNPETGLVTHYGDTEESDSVQFQNGQWMVTKA